MYVTRPLNDVFRRVCVDILMKFKNLLWGTVDRTPECVIRAAERAIDAWQQRPTDDRLMKEFHIRMNFAEASFRRCPSKSGWAAAQLNELRRTKQRLFPNESERAT